MFVRSSEMKIASKALCLALGGALLLVFAGVDTADAKKKRNGNGNGNGNGKNPGETVGLGPLDEGRTMKGAPPSTKIEGLRPDVWFRRNERAGGGA
jgi:hypothetical protein